MTELSLNYWSESDQQAIREQVARILRSGPFHQSRRRQRFLDFIVNETLAGRSERLKGYNIALEVFDRPETFDPVVDPIVRIEAARLREKLREYYDTEGHNDSVRIDLQKGGYAPHIEFRQAAPPELAAERLDAITPNQHLALVQPPVASADQPQAVSIAKPADADIVHALPAPASRRTVLQKIGWKPLAISATALLMIVAGGLAWLYWSSRPSLPEMPSIAVLPFENIGDDPKWARFADGITEDIITDLAHSKGLLVIARNSTEVYKGKPIDIRQVGRDLNVKYVLEGSIQSISEQIRVSAQLIDAASGSHVWSERYDRPVDDLFAVQNDVTGKIAATLTGYQGSVAEAERNLLRRKPPASLTAYDTYLLAIEAKHKVTKESLIEAERLFRKALELDPQLARAYVGLANVYFYLIDLGLAPSVEEAQSKLMEAAEKAVALDPDDAHTHQALAMAYAYHGKPEQALAEYDRAETLAPSDADLLLIIGWSLPQFGQSSRAMSLAERALKLNPYYPDWYNQGLSLIYFFGELYDRSVKYRLLVKKPLSLDYAFLAMADAYLGRTGEADAAAANVKKLDPSWIAERYLSEAGGYAEKEAELFVQGAGKAELSDCVPAEKLQEIPKLIRVKSCDQQRAKTVQKSGALVAPTTGEPKGPAIAVLPFVNLSGDPNQDYFSDGLTEDILTELSRGRDLRVLARNTTFQYKGQAIDVRKLGRELKARYVLEGSVRRTGDRLRVTAQLIDTETGGHVWAERYDREMADVFLVQDEIVSQIVGNIAGNRGVIEFAEGKAATRKAPSEIQAYDLVLRAQEVMRPEWNRETFRAAKASLRQAIALDPLYARPRRELAYLAALGWVYRFDETPVPPQEILAQANRAVQLDPADARARVVLASVYFWTKQLDLFEREAQQAITLAPYDGEILASVGCMFARSGQWKRGVELAKKANALNPDAAVGWYQSTMVAYSYEIGDYERALALRRQHPDQKAIHAYIDYIAIYGQLGRKQDALEYWHKLKEVDRDWSAETFMNWYRLWNMRDEDIAKFMDGVYKSGALEAGAPAGAATHDVVR